MSSITVGYVFSNDTKAEIFELDGDRYIHFDGLEGGVLIEEVEDFIDNADKIF